LAKALGADGTIVDKVPAADLESERPGRPDAEVFGVTYEDIDDSLEARDVPAAVRDTIVGWYERTADKRSLPPRRRIGQPPRTSVWAFQSDPPVVLHRWQKRSHRSYSTVCELKAWPHSELTPRSRQQEPPPAGRA
jgi:hypothetical protein